SDDGKYLASSGADRTARIWDPSGKLLVTLPSHTNWVSNVAFSADGKQLATASHDRTVKIWSLEEVLKPDNPLADLAAKADAARIAAAEARVAAGEAKKT